MYYYLIFIILELKNFAVRENEVSERQPLIVTGTILMEIISQLKRVIRRVALCTTVSYVSLLSTAILRCEHSIGFDHKEHFP